MDDAREVAWRSVDLFAERGFLRLPGFFEPDRLTAIEGCVTALYAMQARKCGYTGRWPELLEEMEATDKEALYQVQKLIPQSQARSEVDTAQQLGIIRDLLGVSGPFLIEGPGLFISRPNTQRLLYKWHQEGTCCYPMRRRFVNAWFPLFGDKTAENGAMSVLVGSHKQTFPFTKYRGYDHDTRGAANHFDQYEIPENFLTGFEEHRCPAKRGDLILFDRMTVHRSNLNTTDAYSFAMVARIWTPVDDLTLSGRMDVNPYEDQHGRAGMIVNP